MVNGQNYTWYLDCLTTATVTLDRPTIAPFSCQALLQWEWNGTQIEKERKSVYILSCKMRTSNDERKRQAQIEA